MMLGQIVDDNYYHVLVHTYMLLIRDVMSTNQPTVTQNYLVLIHIHASRLLILY
jgi:hypothetical protein